MKKVAIQSRDCFILASFRALTGVDKLEKPLPWYLFQIESMPVGAKDDGRGAIRIEGTKRYLMSRTTVHRTSNSAQDTVNEDRKIFAWFDAGRDFCDIFRPSRIAKIRFSKKKVVEVRQNMVGENR